MAQARALIEALKNVLKARGITYAQLAKGLNISEASVKRAFSTRSFTLSRLDRICALAGVEISDLAQLAQQPPPSPDKLTRAQEQELVSDPKLLLTAVHAVNHWTFDEIIASYAFTPAELTRMLMRLDKLGIIELLPHNKMRVKLARDFAWLPDGPIQQYFRAQLQSDFFRARFDADGESLSFVNGMLSAASNATLQNRLRQLAQEFSALHNDDAKLPLEHRYGTSLLIALRPWMPEAFQRYLRAPGARKFK